MAVQTIPGLTGFAYSRVSSMDKRAIGKLTDTNHLSSFHDDSPADYDKKIISIYTQSSLYSNDFLDMINKSNPYTIDKGTDSWKWNIEVPFKFPKIIDIPTSTRNLSFPGIDGQEFQAVLDSNEFAKNSIISVGSRQFGPRWYVVQDPQPWNNGFLYTFTLVSDNPKQDYVDARFLKVGLDVELIDGSIGEFDQELLGLPRLGEKITMFETLSSGYGFEHTITSWADAHMMKDENGNPKDILVHYPVYNPKNRVPLTEKHVRWEPFIEYMMRKAMLETKVKRMIWGQPGTVKTNGSKQELKRTSSGVYDRMRRFGNYVPYNRGEFTVNLIRTVFGDLYYRRVDVGKRHVKLYTNEAGFDVFQQAVKNDVIASGLALVADSGDRYIQGKGQHLVYNWAFDSFITRETGKVELVHLKELDLPQTSLDFGQNKKSTPTFFVFDVSSSDGGGLKNNIREVRLAGQPSMTWGYVDGRRHHLGFAKSQGMSSASKFPGYTIWMEDRSDIFIEDLSRCVLLEEIPQF